MSAYLINNLKKNLSFIKDLKEDNKFYEHEIRFGKFSKVFDPKLSPEVFQKIYDKFLKDNEHKNQVIVDYIFNKKTVNSFFGKKTDFDFKKSNFMKKIVFPNQYEDIDTSFSIEKYNEDIVKEDNDVVYMLKEKKTQHTFDNTRYSYNIERNIDINKYKNVISLHQSNQPYETIRLKNRYYTIVNGYIELDLTIVKKFNTRTMKQEGETEYIIEIELQRKLDDETKMLSGIKLLVKEIRREYFNKKDFIFNLGTMNPATMEKKDLVQLKTQEYTVTDKADGERTFLIFLNEKIYLFNPKTKVIIKEFENNVILENTVIDGEYLSDRNEFLAFDALLVKYHDVRLKSLSQRLNAIKKVQLQLDAIKEISVKIKKFYTMNIFEESKKLWDNRKTLFNYELDGLIFTPENQFYVTDQQEIPVLKWKEELSIDVRVEYNRRENFTYFHYGYGRENSREWTFQPPMSIYKDSRYHDILKRTDINWLRWQTTKQEIIENIGNLNLGKTVISRNNRESFILGLYGVPQSKANVDISPIFNKYDIIEYNFDFKLNQWVALRKRTFDKEQPNAYRTIESVLNSILNYISIDDIYELQFQSSENIGLLYDLTKDKIKRKQWRNFNNFGKNELYKKISKNTQVLNPYHLELACGKLGDLQKYIKNGYKNILAIDSSRNEIYEKNGAVDRLKGLGFVKKDYYYQKDDMKVTVFAGDVTKSIKGGLSGLTKEDKEICQKFFDNLPDNWNGFDSISIMYAIHYFFGNNHKDKNVWVPDKTSFEGFTKNIKDLLKYNGLLFGTYLNGDNMSNEKMMFIKDGDLMYQITPTHNEEDMDKVTYDKFFKQKQINSIEIENEVWAGVKISEPKINKHILETMISSISLKSLITNTTTEQFYSSFIEEFETELSPDEKRLSFINNIFVFGYLDMDKIKILTNDLLNINIYNTVDLIDYLRKNIEDGNLNSQIKELYNIFLLEKN